MNHTFLLRGALPLAALPALLVLVLPSNLWTIYADVIEPVVLLLGSFLCIQIAKSYTKELKAAFIFLAVFLQIYAFAIISLLSYSPVVLPYLQKYLQNEEIYSLVQSIQFINYAVLFLFCVNVLKVINVTQLDRRGWFVFSFAAVYAITAAIYPAITKEEPSIPTSTMVVRIFDAAIVIVLVPVLWLYVQHLKAQHKQSLTFTIVIFGIVISTIFDYIFELLLAILPGLLPNESLLRLAIPEALFVYGYSIIVLGLYAHRKQEEWGFHAIEKAMSGEGELA